MSTIRSVSTSFYFFSLFFCSLFLSLLSSFVYFVTVSLFLFDFRPSLIAIETSIKHKTDTTIDQISTIRSDADTGTKAKTFGRSVGEKQIGMWQSINGASAQRVDGAQIKAEEVHKHTRSTEPNYAMQDKAGEDASERDVHETHYSRKVYPNYSTKAKQDTNQSPKSPSRRVGGAKVKTPRSLTKIQAPSVESYPHQLYDGRSYATKSYGQKRWRLSHLP